MSEKDKKIEGYNTKEDSGIMRDPMNITSLRVYYDYLSYLHSHNFAKNIGQYMKLTCYD